MDSRSPLVAAGAINGAVAVAAGAFAAHGLRDRLETRALEIFETAARYHMYHALAMVLAGLLLARRAGWTFQLGIALFSGSLYALALTDVKVLGAVTPLGGLAFLVGWLWLAITALKPPAAARS
ncbi:MAG: DUF423 domain-containing protein [Deltaproteobacteria bacterium]|nr:DUF423 domain-containing protein [Deltaproteobacteria bacterium]